QKAQNADAINLVFLRLRTCRKWPRGGGTAEQVDELAPPHGAYPKARDNGLSIEQVRSVHRGKKRAAYVRSGSFADIAVALPNVCLSPKADIIESRLHVR